MAHLIELFAIPSSADKVGEFGGNPLYSSESLDNKFIEAIKASIHFDLLSNIESLVKNKEVIPVFTTQSTLSFFLKKLPFAEGGLSTLGFYDSQSKKIFILIDNNSNIFGITSNEGLSILLVHELIHKFAFEKPSEYLYLFKRELISYYKVANKKIFDIDLSLSDTEKLITTIYKKVELKKYIIWKNLFDIYYSHFEGKNESDKKLRNSINTNILAANYALTQDNRFFMNPYIQLHYKFKDAYKDCFNINVKDKSCWQELMITSEVISSISEYNFISNKIEKAIKSLT